MSDHRLSDVTWGGAETGVKALGDYSAGTNAQKIDKLLALVADPTALPATTGGNYLDQMSPAAAVQLRVELKALKAALA